MTVLWAWEPFRRREGLPGRSYGRCLGIDAAGVGEKTGISRRTISDRFSSDRFSKGWNADRILS